MRFFAHDSRNTQRARGLGAGRRQTLTLRRRAMTVKSMKSLVWVLVGIFGVCACASSSSSPGSGSTPTVVHKGTLGQTCAEDSDCESGFCLNLAVSAPPAAICSKHCSSDADCSGDLPRCGTGTDGSSVCAYACPSNFHRGFTCVAGAPVACGADQSLCEDCGCPDSMRCEVGLGCAPKSDVGGPCRLDGDCKTGNCSTIESVCRVPVGSACTAKNCDLCQTAANGYSFCNRACDYDSECNGSVCLTYSGALHGICYQKCNGFGDTSCPGSCMLSGDNVNKITYCDCSSACSIETTTHPLGAECSSGTDCESGRCYTQCAPHSSCTGWCSQGCTQSSGCGGGSLVCVNVPCVDKEACGAQCLPPCTPLGNCKEGYFCRELQELGTNATRAVCDIKLPEMVSCSINGQCQSGLCFMGVCVAPGGDKNPNGGNCDTSADCQSNNCIAGKCRGHALLGDACAADYDCAAGTCCTSGANAGTCNSSCF